MSFGHLAHSKPSLEVGIVTGPHADVVAFESGSAIVAGDVVKLDVSATGSAKAATIVQGGADGLAIGIALEAATGAGEQVRVCIAGYVEGVNAAAGATAGDALSAVANGQVDDTTPGASLPALGVCLVAEAGNRLTMYWFRKY